MAVYVCTIDQECVSEFICFITSEASDKCKQEKRKTINGEDLLWAMSTLGFDKYVDPLKIYLAKCTYMYILHTRLGRFSADRVRTAAAGGACVLWPLSWCLCVYINSKTLDFEVIFRHKKNCSNKLKKTPSGGPLRGGPGLWRGEPHITPKASLRPWYVHAFLFGAPRGTGCVRM